MSKISKSLAMDIAEAMVADKKEEISKLQNSRSELTTEIVLKMIPDEVLKLFNKFPNYIQSDISVYMGRGASVRYVTLTKPLPCKRDERFDFSDSDLKKIENISRKIEDKKDAMKRLISDINNAIIALGTEKRLKESFPEAAKFLPEKKNFLPSVNLNSIRERL